ncbi:TetR/AcrR family transcriptional regulator [Thermocrispum agreste]|uniref:TetR/AcrR family transcriptional regulator n=1 Tax=Thermocrispum agreste TaxID=37925 RepID=UPI000422BEC9|nr:TetR/AcrR family transcriptional regulator [Thermocrispum agreste]
MSRCNAVRRSTEDVILDAAAELIQHTGGARVNIAEIARRAGVSRPTIYRRWPDVRAIVAALLTREVRAIARAVVPAGQDREALVAGVVEIAERVRDHPVLGLLLRTDPEVYRRYFVERLGTSQRGLLRELQSRLAAAQADGTVRDGDPEQMAAMVLLIAETTVQSYRTVTALVPEDAWRRELTHVLNRYLAP